MPAASSGPVLIPAHTPAQIDHTRWYSDTIMKMVLDYSNQAVKFLLLANAGGAVALLSFMGADERVRGWIGAWNVLELFVIGMVLAIAVTAINFFGALYLAYGFGARMKAYNQGRLPFPAVFQASPMFVGSIIIPILVAIASLVCFSWGAWTGIQASPSLLAKKATPVSISAAPAPTLPPAAPTASATAAVAPPVGAQPVPQASKAKASTK